MGPFCVVGVKVVGDSEKDAEVPRENTNDIEITNAEPSMVSQLIQAQPLAAEAHLWIITVISALKALREGQRP